MPNTKSATKRLRQSLERRARNRSARSTVRNQVRKVRKAIESGDVAQSETELRIAAKKLDQAAAKRIVHANSAARTKSRLSAAIRAIKTSPAAEA
jgi:small subunit ribosomal protein S20